MFQAFVIICAASASFEIYEETCKRSDDMWGPYKTEENCQIRANQMVDNIINGPLNEPTFYLFGNPPQIYVEGLCKEINLDPAV